MAIILSKAGENAVRLDKSSFGDEKYLQNFVCQNPDSVPLYDIKADMKLLILGREFPTAAGPIDALGVDREGEIYIVETKLYKNPDKRAVVAQVLDYGANLWKYGRNFDEFVKRLDEKLNSAQRPGLNARLAEYYGLDEEETENFRERMRQHLTEGTFKFLVLMDSLHDGLKDLLIFLNENSRFAVFAVEVEYYKHDGFEIIIPKLFGVESKSRGGCTRLGKGAVTRKEFLRLLEASVGPEVAALGEQVTDEAPSHGLQVKFGTDGASLKFTDVDSGESFNLGKISKDGKLAMNGSFSAKCSALKVPRAVWQSYYEGLREIVPGTRVEPWPNRKDLLWLSDTNNDWPNAEPLLRNRVDWFKCINDTMVQIRPFLTAPEK